MTLTYPRPGIFSTISQRFTRSNFYLLRLEVPLKANQFLLMTRTLIFCVAEEAKHVSQFAVDQGHRGGSLRDWAE